MMLSKLRSRRLTPKRPKKTKADHDHLARIAAMPCCVCGKVPVEVHHIRSQVGMGRRASHFETIPLCSKCHRTGDYGVAFHAGKKAFEDKHGTELELLDKVRKILGV